MFEDTTRVGVRPIAGPRDEADPHGSPGSTLSFMLVVTMVCLAARLVIGLLHAFETVHDLVGNFRGLPVDFMITATAAWLRSLHVMINLDFGIWTVV